MKTLIGKGNFAATRWVLLKERTVLPNIDSRVTKGQKNVFAQNIQESLAPHP